MMNLSDVRKRLVTILVVVLAVVLVGCAGTSDEGTSSSGGSGERQKCSECEPSCEHITDLEERADCVELCIRDCTP